MKTRNKLQIEALGNVALQPGEANFLIEYSKDFNHRRAAEASGMHPDEGSKLLKTENIIIGLSHILLHRLDVADIDVEWVLMECVDNHLLARQAGNLPASNTALNLIMKHTLVDAVASDKLNMNVHTDKEVMDRLFRGRERAKQLSDPIEHEEQETSFL